MLCVVMLFGMTACGPPKVDMVEEIAPNESAFIVPLEGNTGAQGKFMSVEYLEKNKVASKRVYLPQTKLDTGRFWWSYKYVPTVLVVKVDRKPITFEWDADQVGGKVIRVESRDSIGFSVGTNISAFINESDTSTFLYYYPSGDLNKVLGNEVFSRAVEVLSRQFAMYDLEGSPELLNKKREVIKEAVPGAREQKGVIVDLAKKELVEYFAEKGVTITTFGLVGGLSYENVEIQNAINQNFESELEIKNQANIRLAQQETNQKNIGMAEAEKDAALKFEQAAEARKKMVDIEVSMILAQAELEKAKRWNGQLPANIMPEGANFILGMK